MREQPVFETQGLWVRWSWDEKRKSLKLEKAEPRPQPATAQPTSHWIFTLRDQLVSRSSRLLLRVGVWVLRQRMSSAEVGEYLRETADRVVSGHHEPGDPLESHARRCNWNHFFVAK
jgi:hypothetical protein